MKNIKEQKGVVSKTKLVKKLVPPAIKQWKETRVDKLKKKVGAIQESCEHSFCRITKLELAESIIPDVYANEHNEIGYGYTIKCTKCSQERDKTPFMLCPICLSKMEKGGTEERAAYWGEDNIHYVARIYQCSSCNFKIVTEEYDGT